MFLCIAIRCVRCPWLESGGECRVAHTPTSQWVEGHVVHFCGIARSRPQRIEGGSVRWTLRLEEDRLAVDVTVHGLQESFLELEVS